MRLNEDTVLVGRRCVLVPYKEKYVTRYHAWMQDDDLLALTASERLTLDEEVENQKSWRDDAKKLTFIVLDRAQCFKNGDDRFPVSAMVGDVNAFLTVPDEPLAAEVDVMVPERRRRGFGGEAVRLLLRYGREALSLSTFVAKIASKNAASLKLFAALGFERTNYVEAFDEVELRSTSIINVPWTVQSFETAPAPGFEERRFSVRDEDDASVSGLVVRFGAKSAFAWVGPADNAPALGALAGAAPRAFAQGGAATNLIDPADVVGPQVAARLAAATDRLVLVAWSLVHASAAVERALAERVAPAGCGFCAGLAARPRRRALRRLVVGRRRRRAAAAAAARAAARPRPRPCRTVGCARRGLRARLRAPLRAPRAAPRERAGHGRRPRPRRGPRPRRRHAAAPRGASPIARGAGDDRGPRGGAPFTKYRAAARRDAGGEVAVQRLRVRPLPVEESAERLAATLVRRADDGRGPRRGLDAAEGGGGRPAHGVVRPARVLRRAARYIFARAARLRLRPRGGGRRGGGPGRRRRPARGRRRRGGARGGAPARRVVAARGGARGRGRGPRGRAPRAARATLGARARRTARPLPRAGVARRAGPRGLDLSPAASEAAGLAADALDALRAFRSAADIAAMAGRAWPDAQAVSREARALRRAAEAGAARYDSRRWVENP